MRAEIFYKIDGEVRFKQFGRFFKQLASYYHWEMLKKNIDNTENEF